MFQIDDTIVAIAIAAGPGGIGVVRISGAAATACSRRASSARRSPASAARTFRASEGRHRWWPPISPRHIPTPGDDVVEISAHGSPVVLRQILEDSMAAGARLAEPGEFTLRAFLHGTHRSGAG
jgi:tRNA modification GTPase